MAQDVLSTLDREAKENVYAILDPHIQYEITINKLGEPPKYLSLSKPLSHQRAHAFDPQNIHTIDDFINNNNCIEHRFSTFKSPPVKEIRRSNRSDRKKEEQRNVSKSNNDIEFIRDPLFDISNNTERNSKNYSRMYERNNSGRSELHRGVKTRSSDNKVPDVNRRSNRSLQFYDNLDISGSNDNVSIEEDLGEDNDKPKPGKVREIASKFNKGIPYKQSFVKQKNRPKPLNSYGNQAYLDHVFPDAIEI